MGIFLLWDLVGIVQQWIVEKRAWQWTWGTYNDLPQFLLATAIGKISGFINQRMEWDTPFSDQLWHHLISSAAQLRLWTACASLCTYIDTNSNQHVPCAISCAGYCWALTDWWWKNFIVSRGFHYLFLSCNVTPENRDTSWYLMIFRDHVCFPYCIRVV